VAVCAYLGCDPGALKTREALGARHFVASFCGLILIGYVTMWAYMYVLCTLYVLSLLLC